MVSGRLIHRSGCHIHRSGCGSRDHAPITEVNVMFEFPFNTVETLVLGGLALGLVASIAIKILKAEFRSKECVFCGRSVPADEYAHHLEICGLKKLRGVHSSPKPPTYPRPSIIAKRMNLERMKSSLSYAVKKKRMECAECPREDRKPPYLIKSARA